MASARLNRSALVGLASTAALGLGGMTVGISSASAAAQVSVEGTCALTVTVSGLAPGQSGTISVGVDAPEDGGEAAYARTLATADDSGTATFEVAEEALPDGTGSVRWTSRESPDTQFELASAPVTVDCITAPEPTETTDPPEPTETTDPPEPTETTDPPEPTETTDDPEPTATETTDEPEPTATDDPEPTATDEPEPSHTTSGPKVDTGVEGEGVSAGVLGVGALTVTGGIVAAGALARRRLNGDDS